MKLRPNGDKFVEPCVLVKLDETLAEREEIIYGKLNYVVGNIYYQDSRSTFVWEGQGFATSIFFGMLKQEGTGFNVHGKTVSPILPTWFAVARVRAVLNDQFRAALCCSV